MKMNININGIEKEIDLKNPKGKHTKKGLKMMLDLEQGNTVNTDSLEAYLNFIESLACEMTGLTPEELDELDSDIKDKILLFYQEKINHRIDFLKSSLKQESSGKVATQA